MYHKIVSHIPGPYLQKRIEREDRHMQPAYLHKAAEAPLKVLDDRLGQKSWYHTTGGNSR